MINKQRWQAVFTLGSCFLACSVSAADLLTMDNGSVRVGIDRSKGAAITWLSSTVYPKNMVNLADPGRLIQQSYYAGKSLTRVAEGQSKRWSPWSWNPIQGGGVGPKDSKGAWARVTQFSREQDVLYSETIPKLWDMADEEADAVMRQWTTFEPDMPGVIRVRCEIQCLRQPNDRWGPARMSPQEIPACYFTRNFADVRTYLGDGKWRDESQVPGPPWGKTTPPRKAMAMFEKGGQGVAVFSPTSQRHWNFGPHREGSTDKPTDGPCMHVAPITRVLLGPKTIFRYRYWLVVGDQSEMTSRLNSLWTMYSDEQSEVIEPSK